MEINYADTLEYLLNIRREKKKKDPSKMERDEFRAAWVKLAGSEGYSERVERYLYSGVSYCGAKPLKEYIDTLDVKEQGLQSFFTGKIYGSNSETTFRLLVHLFALLLNDKNAASLASMVIMRIPNACFNKEKKRLGNIDSILAKYFFAELNPNVQLIPLGEMGIKKPIFIDEFISVMETSLRGIDTTALSKIKTANIDKISRWIEEYRQTQADATKTVDSAQNDIHQCIVDNICTDTSALEEEYVSAELAPDSNVPASGNENVEADNEGYVEPLTYLVDLASKVSRLAVAANVESSQQKIKIDALTRALEAEQKKLYGANQQIADLQKAMIKLREKLSAAEGDIFGLKQEVKQREAVIAEKDAEIEERIKMAEVLSRDRNKQADESIQRLASKIRVEYRDFVDALDVPMSCDLGENLRFQLQSVFDILEKGGMKFK